MTFSFKQFLLLTIFSLAGNMLFSQDIAGVVKDSIFGKEIAMATVTIIETDQSAVTDLNGRFKFKMKGEGVFTIKVNAENYQTQVKIATPEQKEITVKLFPQHVDLNEVTVSGSTTQSQNQNAFHIETRKLSSLTTIAAVNMGEVISRIPGVYQSSLGNGISKPVIRGMQGMRVVSLINGLRIEGQQWGGDHGMGIAELGIGSVEVIKGPASLLYGADALGGVIYFSDAPYAPNGTYEISSQNFFQSNTLGGVSRFLMKNSTKKVRWIVGASYANHADYQLPDNKFAKNSRFNELVLKSSLSFNGKKSVHHLRYSYNHITTGIPGHSHDSIVYPELFQVTDQKRVYSLPAQFFSNHYFNSDNKWYGKSNEWLVMVGVTSNRLIEYDEKVTIPSLSMSLTNGLYNIKWTNKTFKNIKFVSGLQGMAQFNVNATNASDTLIPNSSTFDNGVYTSMLFTRHNWNFQAGVRYDFRYLETHHAFIERPPVTKLFSGINSSAGAVYSREHVVFRSSISTGFRAPHLTELLSNGFHHGALRYEIGDLNLSPEKATQLDVTLETTHEHLSLILNPFVNYIRNYIALQPLDSLVDGIPVFEYRQVKDVIFYGTDVGLHYHPHFAHKLHLESTFSLVKIQSQSDSSVSLIPQPRILSSARYSFNAGKKIILKEMYVQHVWMGRQYQVAYNELPTNAYNVIDAAMKFASRNNQWEFNLGCKNILNVTYIDHLSRLKNIGMPAPGRNFYISITYQLKQTTKNQ